MQIYGSFKGCPLTCALFGLVSYTDPWNHGLNQVLLGEGTARMAPYRSGMELRGGRVRFGGFSMVDSGSPNRW